MKTSLTKEIPLLLIVLIPFAYLALVWKDLPQQVPMHYDWNGKIDRYGDKSELILLPFTLPLLTWLILIIVPRIDPKKKMEKMGNKFQSFKFILITFMSALATYAVHSSRPGANFNPITVFMLMGILFAILGHYFQSMRPNYFIGIRTPWTLENEQVWKDTHKMGGKIWMACGILLVVSGLFIPSQAYYILFVICLVIMVLVPTVYSYRRFKMEDSTPRNDKEM